MDGKTAYVLTRLEAIEQEIEEIRKLLAAEPEQPRPSLYGILKGLEISDEDIEAAKRSLFKAAYDEDV